MSSNQSPSTVDVVVVGAGFSGMYLLQRLRGMGLSTRVIETGDDVGGTWYWNRYPGARVDIQSVDYSYSWDPELDDTWKWSEKYSPQPEILRYAQHVADKHDLRRDITFSTRIESARWDDAEGRWHVRTSGGEDISCRFYVMATGCLSMPKEVDIEGTDRFGGEVYFTNRWPHDPVDFTDKRVAVIGTGSSAIQSIPVIAQQAGHVTVFQRTPNFSIPAHNGPVPADKQAAFDADPAAYRAAMRLSAGGVTVPISEVSALAVSDEERLAHYERAWEQGGIIEFLGSYMDHIADAEANDKLAEFVRNKIRSIVDDPETAEALCPKGHPIGTKRLCVDTGYYQTYNRPNVRLVDLRAHPIATITETGIDLVDESFEFDMIVFATGFDAMTGAIVGVDIEGRSGLTLKEAWADGPLTYLGLTAAGFPNLFLITGPGSPSVLSNMMVSIEQHVEWVSDCIADLQRRGIEQIEPTDAAVDGWVKHGNDFANLTLMPQANSWYMGANVPGKPRVFLPYVGGVDRYRGICDEVMANDYLGFELRAAGEVVRRDETIVRKVSPDVMVMLEVMATLDLPPMDSMSPTEARTFVETMSAARAPGPDVGEVVDGTLPGAAGDLAYRLFRPATPGPHDVVVYFHGGGWVWGNHVSDEPMCRDLCVHSDAIVISVDYRHAPEHPFPAAPDDAYAAVQWVADHAGQLGGIPGRLAVAGWSAGATLAAVVCQQVRDLGGPAIAGQVLLTPVTDCSTEHPSFASNGEGYLLTAPLLRWFYDHTVDADERTDPRVSPLLARTLAGLPPAMIVTCEFDPLRDEGDAYATALADAGVPVQHVRAEGQIHSSILAVDMLTSGAPYRTQMASALREFLGARVPA